MSERSKKTRRSAAQKAAPTTAKGVAPALKQKTLFDAFTRKDAPVSTPPEESLATLIDLTQPLANTQDPSHAQSLLPLAAAAAEPTQPSHEAIRYTPPVSELPSNDSKIQTPPRSSGSSVDATIALLDNSEPITIPDTPQGQATTGEGLSQENPIMISPMPIKRLPNPNVVQPHPFFLPKAKTRQPPSTSSKRVGSTCSGLFPPYPDKESQHVKGPQTAVTPLSVASQRTSSQSVRDRLEETVEFDSHLPKTLNAAASATERSWPLPSLTNIWKYQTLQDPLENEGNACQGGRHPAIEHMAELLPEDFPQSHRPWTEKWRPYRAQDVLGNESNGIFLRSWLRALELQLEGQPSTTTNKKRTTKSKSGKGKKGIKRPRVIRHVDKARKKARAEDSWIVYTDEEDEEDDAGYGVHPYLDPYLEEEDEDMGRGDPYADSRAEPLGRLHNTILLTGPPGSGKTACVYACAEELGWEVFEVYPGIGKRNGANVENLIGEVGKNHLVHGGSQRGAGRDFFGGSGPGKAVGMEGAGERYSPRKKRSEEPQGREPNAVRQSLILLEEVDVLFKDDVNFWNTVTRIIKECKRPVICTCNDVSLVPVSDLPLQRVLEFKHCPRGVAAKYVGAICAAEGVPVGEEEVMRLCGQTTSGWAEWTDIPEWIVQTTDLRKAINAAQLLCTKVDGSGDGEIRQLDQDVVVNVDGEIEGKGRLSWRQADVLSFLDSEVSGEGTDRQLLNLESAMYGASGDDETGHMIVYDQDGTDGGEFRLDDRQTEMAKAGYALARGVYGIEERRCGVEAQLVAAKGSAVDGVVSRIRAVPAGMWRMDGRVHLEYVPAVRQMVAAEDSEAEHERSKRRTRNSAWRSVILTDWERRGLEWTSYA